MTELINKSFALQTEKLVDGQLKAYITTFDNSDVVGDIMSQECLDEFVKNFDPSIKKLPMLYEHSVSGIIGEWVSLEKTEFGVIGTGELYLDTSLGRDVQALLKRRAVGSVSIGFKSTDYEKNTSGGRTFKSIELIETSVVLRPANSNAQVISVKNDEGLIETKSLKTLLQEAGLTRFEIKALFDGGWKSLKNLREETEENEALITALSKFKL